MILSKACNYGLRAVLYIAIERDNIFLSIKEISEKLDISFHFLTKILQQLTRKQILISSKGPKGGIALARPADEITLADIVIAIDGPDIFTRCLLGLDNCGSAEPCPLHEHWVVIRKQISDLFAQTTLKQLSSQITENQVRLANVMMPIVALPH